MASKEKPTRNFNNQAYLIYHNFVKKGKAPSVRNKSKIKQKALADSANIYKIVGNYTPANFVSKINRAKKVNVYRDLLDLETHKLTSLVPDIKFFRVQGDIYEPFYFPVASELVTTESLLEPGSGVRGVGIKNFSVSFTGNNPFSFDKQIECNLQIFVDNLENIFREPPPGYARLADLFTISKRGYVSLKDGLSREVASEQLNRASNYEISVSMGYSVDTRSNILTASEKRAIQETNLSIRMTLTDHSISVQQDGTATIDVSYIGRLEGILSDNTYSLLKNEDDVLTMAKFLVEDPSDKKVGNLSKEEKKKAEKRRKVDTKNRMRKYFGYLGSDNVDSDSDRFYRIRLSTNDIESFKNFEDAAEREKAIREKLAKTIKDTESEREEFTEAEREASLQQLKTNFHARIGAGNPATGKPWTNEQEDKYYDELDKDEAEINKEYEDAKLAGQKIDQQIKKAKKRTEAELAKSKSIHYLYVGDVLESVSFNVQRNIKDAIAKAEKQQREEGKDNKKAIKVLQKSLKTLKSFKILLGEIPLRIADNKVVKVNIADIPITIDIFTKYFLDEIEQQSKTNLSIKKFLDDLATRLVRKALEGHGTKDAPLLATAVDIRTLNITGPAAKKLDNSKTEVDIDDLPDFIRKGRPKKAEDELEYYIIYAEMSDNSVTGLSGDVKEDVENGIYHFHIGKNRGMLKTIDFSRFDVPFRKEALMLESVSLYDELKMPYTANISMFGNGLFLPGSMIYVNPSSIGFGDPRNKRSAAARLGLGGYYQVLTVNTTFDGTSLSTILSTSYTSWADSDSEFLSQLTPKKEKSVDDSPESSLGEVSDSTAPEFSDTKARDYETVLASDLLTEDEKSAIIEMELGRRNYDSKLIIKTEKTSGTRIYRTKRTTKLADVKVEINEQNEVNITRAN